MMIRIPCGVHIRLDDDMGSYRIRKASTLCPIMKQFMIGITSSCVKQNRPQTLKNIGHSFLLLEKGVCSIGSEESNAG